MKRPSIAMWAIWMICLAAIACEATPTGKLPDGTTDVFLGLTPIELQDGKLRCQQLDLGFAGGIGLASAVDAEMNLLAMRITRSGLSDCDMSPEETAKTLLVLEIGGLSASNQALNSALAAAAATDVRPLARVLSAHRSLEEAARDPLFASSFTAAMQEIVQKWAAQPYAQRQSLVSGRHINPDPRGTNGVTVRDSYSAEYKSVDLEFTDDGDINEVKGILVADKLLGYLFDGNQGFFAPSVFLDVAPILGWPLTFGPLKAQVPVQASPIVLSIVSPATLRPDRVLDPSATQQEILGQGTATVASFTYLSLQLLESVLLPQAREWAKNGECRKDLAELAGQIAVTFAKQKFLDTKPSALEILAMMSRLMLDTDETKPGPGVLRSCLGLRIGEKVPTWLKARPFLSKMVVFVENFYELGQATVLDLGMGYPYLRHQLIGCTVCDSTPSFSCPMNCSSHGLCDTKTGLCSCSYSYGGSACNQCASGFTGYPVCQAPRCLDDSGCASNQYCLSGQCVADICTQNSLFCSGAQVLRCNANGSSSNQVSTCSGSCVSGQCCGGPGEACCAGSNCTAGMVCDRTGRCRADTTPTRTAYRFVDVCSSSHWQSTNGSCYPGATSPLQGCAVCGKTLSPNIGCSVAATTCWQREDDQGFTAYVSDPGYGNFSRIYHCFESGANKYSKTGCTAYGDPVDIGWMADNPTGRFTRPVALCEWFTGAVSEQFLSMKAAAECTGSRRIVVNPFGYVQ